MFKKLSPRQKLLLIFVLVASIVTALIYFEQIAILYVLATLALVTLLIVVAFADLESVGVDTKPAPEEESGTQAADPK